jgi:hypothetical protein
MLAWVESSNKRSSLFLQGVDYGEKSFVMFDGCMPFSYFGPKKFWAEV